MGFGFIQVLVWTSFIVLWSYYSLLDFYKKKNLYMTICILFE